VWKVKGFPMVRRKEKTMYAQIDFRVLGSFTFGFDQCLHELSGFF